MQASEPFITIAGRRIGPAEPPYVIAELSGNHNGSKDQALKVLEAAAEAGAEAVKLQTYTADTLTIDHDGPGFVVEGGLWDGRSLYDLYQEAHTPWEWHADLFARGRELGVTVFSSPFDETAVDFLEELDCPAYKIASFEAMDLPLVRKAAATGKPLIVSLGMLDSPEIDTLLACIAEAGGPGVALLHCVSAYPAPIEASNLRSLPALAARHPVVVGLSDHTLGTTVATTAVGLGAALVEKHVCLNRADGGVDSAFAIEPEDLRSLVADCWAAWSALGEVRIGRQSAADGNQVFRRSLYVVKDIKAGEALSPENVRSIRPGYGLAPAELPNVLGRTALRDLPRGTPLSWADIESK